jgi:dockerin type I repeat protein
VQPFALFHLVRSRICWTPMLLFRRSLTSCVLFLLLSLAMLTAFGVVVGAAQSSELPSRGDGAQNVPTFVPGPDVIVGGLPSLQQFGSSGTQVGLAVGSDSCNNGDVELNFFAMPNTDHPVMAQNLYRMSDGASNDDRFEQIGQSWLTHAFFALQNNACSFGCTPASGGTHLGMGCSNPDSASINGSQSNLGSRAWVNPFTGAFPSNANSHIGHTHTGTSHRILVEGSDLDTTMNPGATYYAEAQFVTPHEYAWCQAHPGQCNMYNNASYRQFNVFGTTSFIFVGVGSTVRMTPAINAWTGATINTIEPAPGVDGRAFIACKVTNPSAGVWHYEYAISNQNLDRSIQSFSVPLGCGITVSNLGFHAPVNPPGFANDGTFLDAGFSNAAWPSNQTANDLSWSSESFAQNQNANAIRWGTLYNFRFDSNRPPQAMNATIGYFKTGSPTTVAIQGPMPDTCNPLQLTSAVSRKTHGGAGDFDVDLPLTGEPGVECRSSGGDHAFVITFSNPVVSGDASVTSGSGNVAGSPTFSGNTMTVNLTGVTDVQQITVTLSNVTDSFAQVLPDTPVSANMLIGDTNGNKTVNASDVAQTKGQSGLPVTAANFRTDVNASGTITASDIAQAKANAGHTLP